MGLFGCCFSGAEPVPDTGRGGVAGTPHSSQPQRTRSRTVSRADSGAVVTVPAKEDAGKSWSQSWSKLSALQMEVVQDTLRKVGGLIGTMAEGRSEGAAPLQALRKSLQLIAEDCNAAYASVSLLSPDGIFFQALGAVGHEPCTEATLALQRVWAVAGNSSGGRGSTGGANGSSGARSSSGGGVGAQSGRGSSVLALKAAIAAGATCYSWRADGTALPPFDWRHLHATGMQLLYCAPIRSGERLLGTVNLGFAQQADLACDGEVFATFLSLVTSNLVPLLLQPALQAYLDMAREIQAAISLDTLMQHALTQARAALSQRQNAHVWFRGALLSSDTTAATLFDDVAQPGILSQAPKRAQRAELNGSLRALWEIQAAGGMLRTCVPMRGTLLHIACSHKKQVMVPDVQKLVNQMGNTHTDLFSCKFIKPPTSVLLFPLRAPGGPIFGALYCMSDIGTDFGDLDSGLIRELGELMGQLLHRQLLGEALAGDYSSIQALSEAAVMTPDHSGTLMRRNSNGSLLSPFASPGASPLASPQPSFSSLRHLAGPFSGSPVGSPTAERMKGLAREFGDNTSNAGSFTSAASGGSFVVQQSASSTGALVTGLTEKLNQKRVMAIMAGTEPNALRDLQLLALIGEGGFARVFKGLWRGLMVAVKVVIVEPGNGKSVMKNAHEIAILQTLAHPQIITAYCCLTDVHVRDVISTCIRAGNTASRHNLAAAVTGASTSPHVTGGTHQQGLGSGLTGGGLGGSLSGAAGLAGLAREDATCHVEVLELCDLGSLAGAMRTSLFALPGHAAQQEVQQAATAAAGDAALSDALDAAVPSVDMPALLRTLLEVAGAMCYLHRLGVVHCDLKPANILLKSSSADARGFSVKLSDFGLSRVEDDDEHNATFPFNSCGTAAYVAPEALVCQKKVNTSVDVYAFGIIMWELYTGQRPYATMKQQAIAEEVVLRGLRPKFHPNTPPAYSSLAQSCWAATSGARPTFDVVMWGLHSLLEQASNAQRAGKGRSHGGLNAAGATAAAAAASTAAAAAASASSDGTQAWPVPFAATLSPKSASHASFSSSQVHRNSSSHNSSSSNNRDSSRSNHSNLASHASGSSSSYSYSYSQGGPFAAVAGLSQTTAEPAATATAAAPPAPAGAGGGIASTSSMRSGDWKTKLTVLLPSGTADSAAANGAATGSGAAAATAPGSSATAATAATVAAATAATAGTADASQAEHGVVPIIRSNSSPRKGPRRTVSFSQVLEMCYADEDGSLFVGSSDDRDDGSSGRSDNAGSSLYRGPRRSHNGSRVTVTRAHSQGEREMNAARELLLARERPVARRGPSSSSGGGAKDGSSSPASRLGPVRLSSVGSVAGLPLGAGGLLSPGTPVSAGNALNPKPWAGEPTSPERAVGEVVNAWAAPA